MHHVFWNLQEQNLQWNPARGISQHPVFFMELGWVRFECQNTIVSEEIIILPNDTNTDYKSCMSSCVFTKYAKPETYSSKHSGNQGVFSLSLFKDIMVKAAFLDLFTEFPVFLLQCCILFIFFALTYVILSPALILRICMPLWYKYIPNEAIPLMCEVSKLLLICLCFGWLRYPCFVIAINSYCSLSDFDKLFSNDFVFIDFVRRTQLSFKADFKSSINFTLFQIRISKLMRQMLIPLKTQLDFLYPFPYVTTRKHSAGSETIATWAVSDADYTPPHNGWGWMCGRVVGCVTSLSRKQSSPQSWLTWSENCSCKKSRRELCGTLDSSQGQTHVSLLCCFSTKNYSQSLYIQNSVS